MSGVRKAGLDRIPFDWLLVKDGLEHLLHLRWKTDISHKGNYGVNNVRIREDELGQHL